MNIDEQIIALKQRIDTARRVRLRAETDLETAVDQVAILTEEMQHRFGVDTAEALHRVRADLEAELAVTVTALTDALDRAGV